MLIVAMQGQGKANIFILTFMDRHNLFNYTAVFFHPSRSILITAVYYVMQSRADKSEVEEKEADDEKAGAVQRNRNVAAQAKSDTNPSAFLPSSRAAAAASFFRFSSSFTLFS